MRDIIEMRNIRDMRDIIEMRNKRDMRDIRESFKLTDRVKDIADCRYSLFLHQYYHSMISKAESQTFCYFRVRSFWTRSRPIPLAIKPYN